MDDFGFDFRKNVLLKELAKWLAAHAEVDDKQIYASLKDRTDARKVPARNDGMLLVFQVVAPDWVVKEELDEATSALDPISTSKIEDLAVELKSKYTIIMVTHNMQQAVRISDNTAFFLLGEMVEYGKSDQLFSMPQDKRTEDYITGRFG